MSTPAPRALRGNAEALTIEWSDGKTYITTWRKLREVCPCASCKAKREAPAPLFAVLKPEETQPVRCVRMEPMGNYAYHIDFSDGHNTGIYSYEFLRRIGDENSA